ncbi:hypothetical protein LR48_Vigan03g219800 [Vigna angularis]|uniref:Uncharacterized protein n=1 Tax=Phaseolus angularis TaxID=3914 RepID=A0A0L9U7V5_PHAAN|nr:hypothetical protein LR48_Vigan03g219800 [Vigna angularis]
MCNLSCGGFTTSSVFSVPTRQQLKRCQLFVEVLMLTDLEADFINPYDASSRINYFIVPEFIGQGLLCAFCLLTGHWIMFLLTVPVTCYHVMLYMKQQHLIDVTEVFRALNSEKKFRLAKLAYYLTIIIITVFRQASLVFVTIS